MGLSITKSVIFFSRCISIHQVFPERYTAGVVTTIIGHKKLTTVLKMSEEYSSEKKIEYLVQ